MLLPFVRKTPPSSRHEDHPKNGWPPSPYCTRRPTIKQLPISLASQAPFRNGVSTYLPHGARTSVRSSAGMRRGLDIGKSVGRCEFAADRSPMRLAFQKARKGEVFLPKGEPTIAQPFKVGVRTAEPP